MASLKPLNVLTLCSDLFTTSGFNTCGKTVSSLLHKDRYTVYDITLSEFTESPWRESTQALVIPPPTSGGPGKLSPRAILHVKEFFLKGGKILSMHSQINRAFGFHLDSSTISFSGSDIVSFNIETTREFYENSSDGSTAITCPLALVFDEVPLSQDDLFPCNHCKREPLVSIPSGAGVIESVQDISSGDTVAILSYVDLCPDPSKLDFSELAKIKETSEARALLLSSLLSKLSLECQHQFLPPLSLSYLVSSESNVLKLLGVIEKAGSTDSYTLEIVQRDEYGGIPVDCDPTDQKLCVLPNPTEGELNGMKFNKDKYFKELKTKTLGHSLLYTPVIASTHTLFTTKIPLVLALPDDIGFISVAGRQTRGKGRGGNVWLSPEGCMMFSTSLHFTALSSISSCVSILQHVVGTAVVHAVRTLDGYQELDLRVKWPNDVYYNRKVKLGGTLVNCLSLGQDKVVIIGVGVNVTNAYPTLSLADCINLHNAANSTSLKPISIEQLLARTLGALEALIDDMERVLTSGRMEDTLFMRLYYKYWLHSEPDNKVYLEKSREHVTITGIDHFGYLVVVEEESRRQMTLQPDGNSFDLMKGLIKMKHHP